MIGGRRRLHLANWRVSLDVIPPLQEEVCHSLMLWKTGSTGEYAIDWLQVSRCFFPRSRASPGDVQKRALTGIPEPVPC